MSEMHEQIKESIVVKEDEIRIIKQKDGNWKAYMLRQNKQLEVRDIDPWTCLMRILTHP